MGDRVIDQKRFDELAARHNVPGASLAVLVGEELHELATGVLNTVTGVEATTDSLFQIASITKPYTATMFMRLVEQGLVGLDTRVVEILPDFKVADAEVTEQVTMRQLLTHTSGIAGDFFHDSGRGDDAVARYVAHCADLGQDHPLGATISYCNTGYNILGRVIEVLTGTTWDEALRTLVVEPLGVGHTWTLAEDVLRFRAAMGHTVSPETGQPVHVPMWAPGYRGEGPCGNICASAADVLAFARLHFTDPSLAVMREPQVAVPSPAIDHWGLGWMLWTSWDGFRVFGHSGDALGQSCRLIVVPEKQVAMVLLANLDASVAMQREVFSDLLLELCDIRMPEPPAPPEVPFDAGDLSRYVGTYERVGSRIDIGRGEGRELRLGYTPSGHMADFLSSFEISLTPTSENVFVGKPSEFGRWIPFVLDGEYVHFGVRAYSKTAA
jgi:CubicO group peptidase (beta-lactamase class C family)